MQASKATKKHRQVSFFDPPILNLAYFPRALTLTGDNPGETSDR